MQGANLEVATTDVDQLKFFEAHDFMIYSVAIDYFSYRVMKIKGYYLDLDRIGGQNPKDFINSKDAIDLFETLDIFELILKYCKPKIKQGWQRKSLLSLIDTLLSVENHHRLRQRGLKMLLVYLEEQTEDLKESIEVFKSVVRLEYFTTATLVSADLGTNHLVGEDEKGSLAKRLFDSDYVPWKAKCKSLTPKSRKASEVERKTVNEKGEKIEIHDKSVIIGRVVGQEKEEQIELLQMILDHLVTMSMDTAAKTSFQSLWF